jgi:Protein of unknown function (DUF2490)
MNHSKHTILFLLSCQLLLQQMALAQNYKHLALWTRYQVNYELPKNWEAMANIHYRRQNDFHAGQLNLNQPLLLTGQIQFSQKLPKYPNVTLIFLQLTVNQSKTLLGKETDFAVPLNREFRVATGVEIEQNVAKWSFRERVIQEFRFQKSNEYTPYGRVRVRALGRYNFNKKVSGVGFIEMLYFTPPMLKNVEFFRFQQFWLSGSMLWKLSPHLTLETGYTWFLNQRALTHEIDDVDVVNLHFLWRY